MYLRSIITAEVNYSQSYNDKAYVVELMRTILANYLRSSYLVGILLLCIGNNYKASCRFFISDKKDLASHE